MFETMFDKAMFADTLDSSWPERTRRAWTTLTSFGLQVLVTGVLLLLPLLRPTGLPSFHQLSTPISLGQPLAEPPALRAHAGSQHCSRQSRSDDLQAAVINRDWQTGCQR